MLEDGFKKHEDLVDDEEHAVRRNVAENLNCPLELLAVLAKDKEEVVRKYVAGNPHCSVEIMKALLEEESYSAALKTVIIFSIQQIRNAAKRR